jgi:hypothetical protein
MDKTSETSGKISLSFVKVYYLRYFVAVMEG